LKYGKVVKSDTAKRQMTAVYLKAWQLKTSLSRSRRGAKTSINMALLAERERLCKSGSILTISLIGEQIFYALIVPGR